MTPIMLPLTTYEVIKLNWPLLSSETKADLETAGTVQTVVQFRADLQGVGDQYAGRLDVRRVVIYTENRQEIDEVHTWISKTQAELGIDLIFDTLEFAVTNSPVIQQMLMDTNDGVMPPLLPPAEPDPEE